MKGRNKAKTGGNLKSKGWNKGEGKENKTTKRRYTSDDDKNTSQSGAAKRSRAADPESDRDMEMEGSNETKTADREEPEEREKNSKTAASVSSLHRRMAVVFNGAYGKAWHSPIALFKLKFRLTIFRVGRAKGNGNDANRYSVRVLKQILYEAGQQTIDRWIEPDDSDDEFEMMDEPLGAESMEAEAAPGVAPGREASPVTPSRHHDAAHIANDYSRDRISTSTAANDGDGLGDDDSDDEASDDKAAKLHNTGPPPLSDEDTERLFIQSAQKTHDGSPNPSLDPRGHARPGKGDEHRHPAPQDAAMG
ncbi:hypothetical protein A1Q1_08304 [Trichosporon asahii var. asahii CBS 2479]|uniref:Uncharacterized protein n=1 Tax=Trichosporon asahii var. asahii (strain ATCC 90039 / CBS 2479 / JCM 2466 / KCTC 7840 / NBRC 103889/ NCYC 2677 / UAMH 7654) TaxID=1186058 RepID=J6F5P2_TRIAS|nr:hypothetical protein A1Q1_08304 [Trichosporon asahii var. asahii CBS 2479]EJT50602.1 hypothetical protein A1Q1_08304 [Trichosporon asahii var. asahii CBS 2479]